MIVNDLMIQAEVEAEFAAYERALVANDVEALDGFFADNDYVVRLGATENLFGYEAIKAFRAARSPKNLARTIVKSQVATYGRDMAVTVLLFRRDSAPGKIGRQMQTWARLAEGWRIVAAHVSLIDDTAEIVEPPR